MSVTISIRHAVKRYGSVTVIPDLSVNIREGELFLDRTLRPGQWRPLTQAELLLLTRELSSKEE